MTLLITVSIKHICNVTFVNVISKVLICIVVVSFVGSPLDWQILDCVFFVEAGPGLRPRT